MPSGRTHDRITLWGLPWVVLLSFLLLRRGELTLILSLAYLFSGLMFGPDLDIHSVQFKRWGLFRWVWLPYQKTLRHRSALSHGFLIGTVIRVIYVGSILLLLGIVGVAIAQMFLNFAWNWHTFFSTAQQQWQQYYWQESLALFVGLEIGAMSHAISDCLGSWWKQARKRKQTSRRKVTKKRKR